MKNQVARMYLNNMPPSASSKNLPNGVAGNIEPRTKVTIFGSPCSQIPNLSHVIIGQLCQRTPHSPRRTILPHHVFHVFVVCSQKQVVGIDAPWVIARMAHKKTLRYFAVRQPIRHTVRPIPFIIVTHSSVSTGGQGPKPQNTPSWLRLRTPRPERLLYGFLVFASTTAATTTSVVQKIGRRNHLNQTALTPTPPMTLAISNIGEPKNRPLVKGHPGKIRPAINHPIRTADKHCESPIKTPHSKSYGEDIPTQQKSDVCQVFAGDI